MTIRKLRELREDEKERITLDGIVVKVDPVGRPITMFWKTIHGEDPTKDVFHERFDENYDLPSEADSFVRGYRQCFEQRNENLYIVPIQFYKIQRKRK